MAIPDEEKVHRLFIKDRFKGEIGGRKLVGAMGIKALVALN